MDEVTIEAGYAPGVMGRCIEMHAHYYAREAGFGREFETVVAAGLAEFMPRLDNPVNQIWRAMQNDRVVGFVAIDGEDVNDGGAHLRWFIVGREVRGRKIGRRLLDAALAFCDGNCFPETYLWTFKGLYVAHHLYESSGFVVAEQTMGSQWGREVLEQRFVRPGPVR